ncbi:MAG: hypothetical protein GC149_01475 [Gammaproteobacteria bacterium]|nr:hypothetical protein [Gammaproteobacteria bacterium]
MADDTRSFIGQAQTANLQCIGYSSTLITGHAFAQYWFEDAYQESKGNTWHHIRREIIFSTTFLEAYLFEWAQSQLTNDMVELLRLFPQEKNIPSLTNKWNKTITQIFKLRALGEPPCSDIEEFKQLIELRNNLLHARASRLSITNEVNISWPEPSAESLSKLQNGWALGVAIDMVCLLNSHAGTDIPNYIKEKISKR